MKSSNVAVFAILLMVLAGSNLSKAMTCNSGALQGVQNACSSAMGGSKPSPNCCSSLKEQQPCYCGYIKQNPNLKGIIYSSAGQNVVKACGLSIPNC